MQLKGIRFKYIALFAGIVILAIGIYGTFFRTSGKEKTTATIVEIQEKEVIATEEDEEANYIAIVEYTVDGTTYREALSSFSSSYKVGKTIEVAYDPGNPGKPIAAGNGMFIYFLIVGAALLVITGVTLLRGKQSLAKIREKYPETTYAPSKEGEERKLYFITDTGTVKVGHQLEDANKKVLYEAKVTKFTVAAPMEFEFIDHEHGTTTPHLVGHTENSENSFVLIDNYYMFTLDGENIWDHLKKQGIRYEASFAEGQLARLSYRIFRDDREMAYVETSGPKAQEIDAGSGKTLGDIIPVQGFYRVTTREENLDLLFVAIMALARTDSTGGGGAYSGFLNKK